MYGLYVNIQNTIYKKLTLYIFFKIIYLVYYRIKQVYNNSEKKYIFFNHKHNYYVNK